MPLLSLSPHSPAPDRRRDTARSRSVRDPLLRRSVREPPRPSLVSLPPDTRRSREWEGEPRERGDGMGNQRGGGRGARWEGSGRIKRAPTG